MDYKKFCIYLLVELGYVFWYKFGNNIIVLLAFISNVFKV